MTHTTYTVDIYIIFKIHPEEMRDVSHQITHDMHGDMHGTVKKNI